MTMVFMLPVSCNDPVIQDGSDEKNLGINAQISECGGFQTKRKHTRMEDKDCSDERLVWHYDQNSHTVVFLNRDVWLNCCGEHTITITFQDDPGVFVIHEIDAPVSISASETSRCLCMCFFAFQIKLPDIPPDTISVQLYRYITDNNESQRLVWQGKLDLKQGNGDELIQANVGVNED
jgi:hypothetical protein